MKELVERLAVEFADKEYAHSYMEAHAVSRIAAQVYALRRQRGWTQRELAEKAGVAQERVSKIESADFSSVTLKSLQKFSEAFDVNLLVSFGKFSDGILDVANLKPPMLEVSPRVEDLAQFCSRRVIEGSDGRWKALCANHLTSIEAMTHSPTSPVVPGPGWQSLG